MLSFLLPAAALAGAIGNVIVVEGDTLEIRGTKIRLRRPGERPAFAGGTARITGVVGRPPPWMIGSLGGRCDVRNEM
jgi:hypothetical protein